MALICNCPLDSALADVPLYGCPSSFGQLQKVIFQRLYKADGTANTIGSTTNDIVKKATWTALTTAEDATKIVVSPYIQAPTTEPGAMRTYGGGNDTLNGIELNIGTEPTTFTGTLLRENQKTIKALKKLMCESNLGVYIVDENGTIGGVNASTSTTTTSSSISGTSGASSISPIPIQSFFVGDKNLGGYDAPDSNAISWSFKPNWSDDLVQITPSDFNPLTDLVTNEDA